MDNFSQEWAQNQQFRSPSGIGGVQAYRPEISTAAVPSQSSNLQLALSQAAATQQNTNMGASQPSPQKQLYDPVGIEEVYGNFQNPYSGQSGTTGQSGNSGTSDTGINPYGSILNANNMFGQTLGAFDASLTNNLGSFLQQMGGQSQGRVSGAAGAPSGGNTVQRTTSNGGGSTQKSGGGGSSQQNLTTWLGNGTTTQAPQTETGVTWDPTTQQYIFNNAQGQQFTTSNVTTPGTVQPWTPPTYTSGGGVYNPHAGLGAGTFNTGYNPAGSQPSQPNPYNPMNQAMQYAMWDAAHGIAWTPPPGATQGGGVTQGLGIPTTGSAPGTQPQHNPPPTSGGVPSQGGPAHVGGGTTPTQTQQQTGTPISNMGYSGLGGMGTGQFGTGGVGQSGGYYGGGGGQGGGGINPVGLGMGIGVDGTNPQTGLPYGYGVQVVDPTNINVSGGQSSWTSGLGGMGATLGGYGQYPGGDVPTE